MAKKRRTSRTGNDITSNLDLLQEIFDLIPAKLLLELRRVCKTWCSLIDHNLKPLPFFFQDNKCHSYRHKRGEGKLARRFFVVNRDFSFLPQNIAFQSRLISFCNGLYLFRYIRYNSSKVIRRNSSKVMHIVCNPSNRSFTFLPEMPKLDLQSHIRDFSLLAFDKKESLHYNVIFLYERWDDIGTLSYAIYSSQKGKWGRPNNWYHGQRLGTEKSDPMKAFYKGVMYVYYRDQFLRFDLTSKDMRIVDLPEGLGANRNAEIIHIGLLSERVCCAQLDGVQLKVWRIEDDERWELIHHNNLAMRTRTGYPHDSGNLLRILAFHPCSDVLLIRKRSTLSFYDMAISKQELLCYTIDWSSSDIIVEPVWPYFVDVEMEKHS